MSCYTLAQSEAVLQEMNRRIRRAILIIEGQALAPEVEQDQLRRAIRVLGSGQQMKDETRCPDCEGSLENGAHEAHCHTIRAIRGYGMEIGRDARGQAEVAS